MGWDETLFGFILKKFSGRGANSSLTECLRLEEVAPVLRLLAGALSGEAIKISPAEGAGSHGSSQLFLPSEIGLFKKREDNRKAYLYRLAYALAARELDLFLPSGEISETRSRALAALAIPRVRARLEAEFPLAREVLLELGRELVPDASDVSERSARALRDPGVLYLYLACGWPVPGADPKSLGIAQNILRAAESDNDLFALQAPSGFGDRHSPAGRAFDEISLLFGRLTARPTERNPMARADESFSPESLSSGTEKKGKPRERAEEVHLGEKKDDENPLVHVFEKVLTADEYNSGKKNLDGSDELEDHEEALQELNLRHVIRSRERTKSIYKSDVMVDGGAPDLDGGEVPPAEVFSYDEWDHSKGSYRRDWCAISKSKARSDAAAAATLPPSGALPGSVKKLRAELEKMMNERRWRNRQMDGPEPDLDALVERAADLKCRRTPSNRVYLSRRRANRDFAATVLVDMSLSTDSWVDNRHVIQVARESVLLLSEVLDGIIDNVSVAAFSSNTRRDCRFLELKAFDEPWSKLRTRLPALTPTGYTRIGPAIRHATAELNLTGAKKKLLLLISDGKPTDYDRYEGTYGIEDVRQAIKEAQRSGLRIRSLAIDAEAKFYLPRMFGVGGYQILPHPGLLAPALSKIFAQYLV